MTPDIATQNPTRASQRHFGIPLLTMVGLAALVLPRVVLHDLQLIDGGFALANWPLALIPIAAWIFVTLRVRSPRPFLTVLTIGIMSGLLMAVTHQLLWDSAFEGALPVVGGSTLIPRFAAMVSGTVTGAAIGAISGLITRALASARRDAG
ncbi:hypothetical protein [Cellulomonas timonensis]|uniref:hypothetical protein n=1 Tax=Cellulomonas timonensis TaxID=1689271 RepID=UPI00082F2A82|nr:hypothetical protein [Cellulomonas timonensis]